ncbi:MAG: ribosomal protein L16/L10AE, partial [Candidatus Promineifilaceae bacterium]
MGNGMGNPDFFSSEIQKLQRIFRVQLGASLPEMRLAWRAFRDDPSLAHANVMIAFV